MKTKFVSVLGAILFSFQFAIAQLPAAQSIGGTLVVAVPVREGLAACSDKRLFNESTGTFTDDFVKIHQVSQNALFVATNTTGFFNPSTGRMEFDVFDLTARYVSLHGFTPDKVFWDGLNKQIRENLLQYLLKRPYKDWPETDHANSRLLFNLVFYTVAGNTDRSYSMSVFYEKAPTPVIDIPNVVGLLVRSPQLLGKGKIVMSYLATKPELARDPSILRFDQANFDAKKTTTQDAVSFAQTLFRITNEALPGARVSATYDCALLDYRSGFRWLTDTP